MIDFGENVSFEDDNVEKMEKELKDNGFELIHGSRECSGSMIMTGI
jgi:hypothetical protein